MTSIRPGNLPLSERFPGEAAWRRQLDLRAEWFVSSWRAIVVLVNTSAWFIWPVPAGSFPALAWLTIAVSWAYVGTTVLASRRRKELPVHLPPAVTAFLDMSFIFLWLIVTGGRQSLFLPLIFAGAATAPLRLSFARGVGASLLYGVGYIAFDGVVGILYGTYVLLIGLSMTWLMQERHVEREQAMRDPLTGCMRREYAVFRIEQLLSKGELPFSVGIMDLDGFKRINDSYGHHVGDSALATVTQVLRKTMRRGDALARFGGDEFLAIWPQTTQPKALTLAEKIRVTIERSSFLLRDPSERPPITISIGVATAVPGDDIDRLIQAADKALYRAKEYRNAVAEPGG